MLLFSLKPLAPKTLATSVCRWHAHVAQVSTSSQPAWLSIALWLSRHLCRWGDMTVIMYLLTIWSHLAGNIIQTVLVYAGMTQPWRHQSWQSSMRRSPWQLVRRFCCPLLCIQSATTCIL